MSFDQTTYFKAYSRDRNKAFRAYIRAVKQHFGCVSCGTREGRLEFHHSDPSTRSYRIAHMSNCSLETLWVEIEKCVVACSQCHRTVLEPRDYRTLSARGLAVRWGSHKDRLAARQFATESAPEAA